jgi:hypothetical protein
MNLLVIAAVAVMLGVAVFVFADMAMPGQKTTMQSGPVYDEVNQVCWVNAAAAEKGMKELEAAHGSS